jgi:hypothetical protein
MVLTQTPTQAQATVNETHGLGHSDFQLCMQQLLLLSVIWVALLRPG